jgi:hypothetical protein
MFLIHLLLFLLLTEEGFKTQERLNYLPKAYTAPGWYNSAADQSFWNLL